MASACISSLTIYLLHLCYILSSLKLLVILYASHSFSHIDAFPQAVFFYLKHTFYSSLPDLLLLTT